MIKVSVVREGAIVGEIEFHGIIIQTPGGGAKVPMSGGQRVPYSRKCRVHQGATVAELESVAERIAEGVSFDRTDGDAGDFHWYRD